MNDALAFAHLAALKASLREHARTEYSTDVGTGDASAAFTHNAPSIATVITREPMVYASAHWVAALLALPDLADIRVMYEATDGAQYDTNDVILRLSGSAHALLRAERSLLNGVQFLSGTATTVRAYADEIKDYPCRLLDSRKTIPAYRIAQKYAAHLGGAVNHRFGLYDAVMLKENHLGLMTDKSGYLDISAHIARYRNRNIPIIMEVENMAELQHAATLNIDRILLDNFTLADMRAAVAWVQSQPNTTNHPIPLEASGNITLDTIQSYAATGVDFISSGAITKHLHAIDLSMNMRSAQA